VRFFPGIVCCFTSLKNTGEKPEISYHAVRTPLPAVCERTAKVRETA
jgi:hypothetical protein